MNYNIISQVQLPVLWTCAAAPDISDGRYVGDQDFW